MPGVIIFNPNDADIGFSVGDDQASGVYLDVEEDVLYFTDTVNIYEWEGGTANKTATWRSGVIRFPRKVNIGAAMIEADSYDRVIFKLYADGVQRDQKQIFNSEPFRLPGGYISNLFEIEIVSDDRIRTVVIGQNVFDLASG